MIVVIYMKRKNKDLKWYAFRYDWNKQGLEVINVLGVSFAEDLLKRIKRDKISTYEELKEGIKRELMYIYWSRAEYEVLVMKSLKNKQQRLIFGIN